MNLDLIIAQLEAFLDLLREAKEPPDHAFEAPIPDVNVKVAFAIGHHQKAKGAHSELLGSEWDWHDGERIKGTLRDAAKKHGVDARFFHFNHARGGYTARCKALAKEINAWGPDYVQELHFNSFHTAQAHGTETLHTGTRGSIALANMIQTCTTDCLGTTPRSTPLVHVRSTGSRGGGLIRRVRAPAALSEPVFGSNASDSRKMLEHADTLSDDLMIGFKRLKGR